MPKRAKKGHKVVKMKPIRKTVPEWLDIKPEEVIELVVKLANEGYTKSESGMILRDQYGIPSVKAITGKTIGQILKEKNLGQTFPEDMLSLIRKSVKLEAHLNQNKKDFAAKRGYELTVSKIRRLTKYYAKKGLIPKDWRFTPESARLLVK